MAVLVVRFERRMGDKGIFAVGIPDMTVEEIRRTLRTSDILVEDGRLFDKALALEPGELVMLSEAVSNHEFVATRFYREWIQPRELHHLVSLMVSRTPKQVTALTLLRKRESPRFADTELDLLQRLVPHLQRVLHIQEMLLGAELKLEVAEQMLESLGCGAILVDDTGARVRGEPARRDPARARRRSRPRPRPAPGGGSARDGGTSTSRAQRQRGRPYAPGWRPGGVALRSALCSRRVRDSPG
ncbi:MAG: hypothetical protein ACREI8_08190, partial [Myxococcota bacterium]